LIQDQLSSDSPGTARPSPANDSRSWPRRSARGPATRSPPSRDLLATLEIPARLRDVGVAHDALPEIVDHALNDRFITKVPCPVNRDELTALLEAAW
jgi:hypothetical protein